MSTRLRSTVNRRIVTEREKYLCNSHFIDDSCKNREKPFMANDSSDKNTYALDPESPEEMARLIELDRVSTRSMGGVFSGLAETDIAGLHSVLDLACGPGGWVLDVAFEHPRLAVTGVDVSQLMMDYARARARTKMLTNAHFRVMNINDPLEFDDASFDLINARSLASAIPGKRWEPLIVEGARLLRPGGILRLTEPVDMGITNSPAFERISTLMLQACQRAGYGFSLDGRSFGLTHILPGLLRKAGFQNIQHKAHAVEFSAKTMAWLDFYRNYEIGFFSGRAFLVRMGLTTQEEIDDLYQRVLIEMQRDDFRAMIHSVTSWGYKA
jgi:SAM-dependent methyltransferase